MRILIINVALRDNPARKLLPIGLGYVASAVRRAGYEFDLLDLDAHPKPRSEVERLLQTTEYDVVLMGCIVTGYGRVKWLSEVIKTAFPRTTIVVGNTVAQSISQTLLTQTKCDVAALGEGDLLVVDLLEAVKNGRDLMGVAGLALLRNGRVVLTDERPVIPVLDAIPSPDWGIFDIDVYIESCSKAVNEPLPPIDRTLIRSMPVNTARGCPYQCTFCYHAFQGAKYRWRSAESVVRELRGYSERYGINHFAFNDELTFHSKRHAEDFADRMLESGLNVFWGGNCRANLFTEPSDVQIVEKLHRAGCLSLVFSLESANEEILRWMKKGTRPEQFARQVEIMRKGGVAPLTSIVIGYPIETAETIRETIDFCEECGIYPSAGYLLPQPGSVMYAYARKEGFIPNEEEYLLAMGDRQDLRINMTRMSDDELVGCVESCLTKCATKLGIEIPDASLLKTGAYRSPLRQSGGDSTP